MDLKLQCDAPIQKSINTFTKGEREQKRQKNQTVGQSIFAEYSFIGAGKNKEANSVETELWIN